MSRAATAGTERQKIRVQRSFPRPGCCFDPRHSGKARANAGNRHLRTSATPAMSRGPDEGHPRSYSTLARTYQGHLPSKPSVDAREIPSIEQLEQVDAKTGDEPSPPQAVSCLNPSGGRHPWPSARSPATRDTASVIIWAGGGAAGARRRFDTQPWRWAHGRNAEPVASVAVWCAIRARERCH